MQHDHHQQQQRTSLICRMKKLKTRLSIQVSSVVDEGDTLQIFLT